jgi:glycerate 2-kinase
LNITPLISEIPGHPERKNELEKILLSGLNRADPYQAVRESIRVRDDAIEIIGLDRTVGFAGKIFIIGAGKASIPMACGAADILGNKIERGVIITKVLAEEQTESLPQRITARKGDHPIPGLNSLSSTRELLATIRDLTEKDLVICLISGGGSALLTAPVVGISLEEIQQMTRALLDCGADISEINTLRKHLDLVKGGGLAKAIAPASMITLVISDVIGNSPSVIASGPTFPDESTFQDAWKIIQKYQLEDILPASILSILQMGINCQKPETLKPGDPIFRNSTLQIIASNENAVEASLLTAKKLGYRTINLGSELSGEASVLGIDLGLKLKNLALERVAGEKPLCLIGGGESTVTRKGDGFGGRNLEIALSAVEAISGLDKVCLITLATDGEMRLAQL